MFLGINLFLALLRAHFNPRYARAKMILSRAKNIFMSANVNSIVILEFFIYSMKKYFKIGVLKRRSQSSFVDFDLECLFECVES